MNIEDIAQAPSCIVPLGTVVFIHPTPPKSIKIYLKRGSPHPHTKKCCIKYKDRFTLMAKTKGLLLKHERQLGDKIWTFKKQGTGTICCPLILHQSDSCMVLSPVSRD